MVSILKSKKILPPMLALFVLSHCATYQRTKIETEIRASFLNVKLNNQNAFKKTWMAMDEKLADRVFNDLKQYINFADFGFEWPGLDSSDSKPLKVGNSCVRVTFFKSGKCTSCYVRLIDADYYFIYSVNGDKFRVENAESGGSTGFNFYIGPDMPRKAGNSKFEICRAINAEIRN
jgi:hypothetical protein